MPDPAPLPDALKLPMSSAIQPIRQAMLLPDMLDMLDMLDMHSVTNPHSTHNIALLPCSDMGAAAGLQLSASLPASCHPVKVCPAPIPAHQTGAAHRVTAQAPDKI